MRRGGSADVSSVKVVHVDEPSPKEGETDLADLAVLHSELCVSCTQRQVKSSPRSTHTSLFKWFHCDGSPATHEAHRTQEGQRPGPATGRDLALELSSSTSSSQPALRPIPDKIESRFCSSLQTCSSM